MQRILQEWYEVLRFSQRPRRDNTFELIVIYGILLNFLVTFYNFRDFFLFLVHGEANKPAEFLAVEASGVSRPPLP